MHSSFTNFFIIVKNCFSCTILQKLGILFLIHLSLLTTSLWGQVKLGLLDTQEAYYLCEGPQEIQVELTNNGSNTLQSVTINWSIEEVLQPPVSYTTPIGTITEDNNAAIITIGTSNIETGQEKKLQVWTSALNGTTDTSLFNDTLSTQIIGALGGTYTIGGINPDYATINEAVSALQSNGICKATVFNIRNGTYNEQVSIGEIIGVDSLNTVTFQAESEDNSQVTLSNFTNTRNENYTLQLNGTDWLTLRNITLEATGSTYSRVLSLTDQAEHNTFESNIFRGAIGNSNSTNNAVVSLSNSSFQAFNTFHNNTIINGSYGIYFNGNSNYVEGTSISNNIFKDQAYRALYLRYQQAPSIIENSFSNATAYNSSDNATIYLERCLNGTKVIANKIPNTTLKHGIYLNRVSGTATEPGLIANNFIHINTTTSSNTYHGIYSLSGTFQNMFFNTINTEYESESSAAFYSSGGNDKTLVNNIFYHGGGGYAIYSNTNSTISLSDYNNLFSTGDFVGYWATPISDLQEWQSTTNFDANSFTVDPLFYIATDYPISEVALNNAGTSIASVTTDIIGATRSAMPDIGAYEWSLATIDAALLEITNPTIPFTVGTQPVQVRLKNVGINELTTASINWQINGEDQIESTWTGNLPSGAVDTVTIGTATFEAGIAYTIEAWIASANSTIDPVMANDTVKIEEVVPGLGGTYTIGGTAPDFATFTEAIEALEIGGVVDSVLFNVRPGTYTEQFTINEYPNADSLRKVTFQSASGNNTDVIIEFDASSANNYIVNFNGADWVTLKNMTLQSTNFSYARVVTLSNGSNHICLSDNILQTTSTLQNTRSSIVFASSSINDDLKLINNTIIGGAYGVYFHASSTNASGLEINNNTFQNQIFRGISLDEHNRPIIKNNSISTVSNSGYHGIYSTDGLLGSEIIANQLSVTGTGIYLDDMNGTEEMPSLVINNFVYAGRFSSTVHGIHLVRGSYQKIINNTINLYASTPEGSALYSTSGNNKELLNNIFANTSIGYALYNNSSNSIVLSDYNNLFTTTLSNDPLRLVYWIDQPYSSLTSLQEEQDTELHSIFSNPYFIQADSYEVSQSALNGAGSSQSFVTTDITGNTRDSSQPDIGAYEFDLASIDAGISTIIPPTIPFPVGSNPVSVHLHNHGQEPLSTVTIDWRVNDFNQGSVNWEGTLPPGDSVEVALNTYNFELGEIYNLTAYTSNPNAQMDQVPANDTSSILNIMAGLSGSYSIGNGADFIDFSDAATSLNIGGVFGPVTFNVRQGTYNEQIVLGEITGADSINTITFQSELRDSSTVTLTNEASSSFNYTLNLEGTEWIIFQDLTFVATDNSYARVVTLNNGAANIVFKNNRFIGLPTTNTSNRYAVVYINSNIAEENIDFFNNTIENGSYGLYVLNSLSGSKISGTHIEGNTFLNQYLRGIDVRSRNRPLILANQVSSNSTTTSYIGLFVDASTSSLVARNKIDATEGKGIQIEDATGTATNPNLTINNFIHVGGTQQGYGFFFQNDAFHKVYHNSVHLTNTHAISRAAYNIRGNNRAVVNNIFANTGGGRSYYTDRLSSFLRSDYNNLFTTGAVLGEVGTTTYNDLNAWRSGTDLDSNSISIDPVFFSTTDLHTINNSLDNTGTPLAEVPTDIDGELRDTATPEIGADEFSSATDDAGIISLDIPALPFSADRQTLGITLLNNGVDSLSTVAINWSINGISQPTFNWTGSLATGQSIDSLPIGNYQFELDTTYTIQIWSSLPNGNIDGKTSNDTLTIGPVYAGLSGSYTIGGEEPDFENFSSAVTALQQGGVAGAVVFNVREGTYEEQISIPEIEGADSLHTILFQSEIEDSTAVILTHATSTNTVNYTLQLNGVDWITFRKLTIQSTSPRYNRVIDIRNGADHNTLANNVLENIATSTSYDNLYADAGSGTNDYNQILFNTIQGGSNGIFWDGSSREESNQFIGNSISGIGSRGMEIEDQRNVIIAKNKIRASRNNIGIYANDCDLAFRIDGNQVTGIYAQGIYLNACDATADNRGRVSNNFVYSTGTTSNRSGLYIVSSKYVDIVHNTLNMVNTSSSSRALELVAGEDLQLLNNIITNFGGGLTIRVGNNNAISTSNYNNFYTTGSALAYWGSNQTDLAAWQNISGQDANSLSLDPQFLASEDYHVGNIDLDKTGTPLPFINEDIEGDRRDAVAPDIGADEFFLTTTNDASVAEILYPTTQTPFLDGLQEVVVLIKNNGINPLTSATIQLEIEGVQEITYDWVGSLAAGQQDTVVIGEYNFTIGTSIDLLAYTELPNIQLDNNTNNDTIAVLQLHPGLAGTYTIGGIIPDFDNFGEAVTALNLGGILDAVTFEVRNGIYEEQVQIQQIKGASAAHPIIFEGETTDSTKVRLRHANTSTDNYIIQLDGTDYVTIQYLTLEATGSFYNTAIELKNGATNNKFLNNRIRTTNANSSDELIYSANSSDHSNEFHANYFIGGGYGIYLKGQSRSILETATIIQNNTFENPLNGGIYLENQAAPQILTNQIQSTRGTNFTGINCTYCDGIFQISFNKILDVNGTGITVSNSDATNTERSLIANNFIHTKGAAARGIYSSNNDFLNVYFNTVHIQGTAATNVAFQNSSSTATNAINNIFASSQKGYAISVSGSIASSNYNALFSADTYLAKWNNTNITDIAAWRSTTGKDANSIETNPLFYSDTDLHVLQVALDSSGTAIFTILTDIDGEPRVGQPDIGADEFAYSDNDVGIVSLLAPTENCELGAAENVKVVIQNFGGLAQSGFDVAYTTANGSPVIENIGNLSVPPGDTISYTFQTPIDLSIPFEYTISAYTQLSNDAIATNDSLTSSIQNYQLPTTIRNMLPADGSNNINLPLNFSWLPAEGAEFYDLYLWEQGTEIPEQPLGVDLSQITFTDRGNQLSFGTTYEWQVIAKNPYCETASAIQSFTLRDLPDLIVESIQLPNTPSSGEDVEISWIVKNQTASSTGNKQWYDYVYLSLDTIFQNDLDTYLGGYSNPTSLTANEQYSQSAVITIPQGIQGTYYILIVTDANKRLTEFEEENNSLQASFQINLSPSPNLQVTEVIVPSTNTFFSGSEVRVNYEVTNTRIGISPPERWNDRIYLQKDSLFDRDSAILLTTIRQSHPALEKDSFYTNSVLLTIPRNTLNGTYYLHVETDTDNKIYESAFEEDNLGTSLPLNIILTPPPDLAVTMLDAPPTASPNQTITIEWSVANIGSAEITDNWRDYIYISNNPTFDLDAVQRIGSRFISTNLSPDSGDNTYQISLNVQLPKDIQGQQYLFLVTDAIDNIFELNSETNNIEVAPISIQSPDLVIQEITVPTNLKSGTSITVAWTLENQSIGDIIETSNQEIVWLSTDTIPSTTDELIELPSYNLNLESSTTIKKFADIVLPDGYEGNYYLIMQTDAENTISEDQESNNISYLPITIQLSPWADLAVDYVRDLPMNTIAGSLLDLTWSVTNQGEKDLSGSNWKDYVYISPLDTFNIDQAVLLQEHEILTPLPAGSSYMRSTQFIIPMLGNNAATGLCFIYVFSDGEHTIYEHGEEDNNVKGRPVLVAAPPPVDLALTEVSAISSSLQAGQSYPLEWEVVNEGSPTTLWNYDLWYDGLFLSTDQEWDEQDIFLKDWTQNGPLDNQGIYTDDQFFDIPNGTSGTYYLLLVADHRYQTEDRNISNNIKIVNTANANNTVFIEQVPTPDLAITNFATVSDGTAGQPFTLEYTVTNIGVATAQPDWSDKVYLSDDFIIDAEDLTLASIPNGTSLSPQQSYTKSEDVFLPQTAKGNYIIIVQTDANDALYEHQAENNNQIAFPIVVDQAPPADLRVTNIEVPTEKITSGTSYNLTWTVANEGAFPASGFTKDIIYLSTDPIWDITDIALTEWTDRIDLAPLSEETRMAEVSIAGVATGDYYIIIKTDVLNNISESREENNTSTSDNQLCITVPELQIGIAKIDTLPNNEGLIYRIEIPDSLAGQTLFTTLVGDVQNGTNELYISHDEVPTRSNHDFAFNTSSSNTQEILIGELEAGTYYVLVYGAAVGAEEQPITILAEIINFSIRDVFSEEGGNTGNVTVKVTGAKFESDMELSLQHPDYGRIPANKVFFINSSEVFASFNLAGAKVGIYNMLATKTTGESTQMQDAFSVVAGSTSSSGGGIINEAFTCSISNNSVDNLLARSIQHPESVRVNRLVPITIQFSNTGNVDIPAPTRLLISVRGAPLAHTPEDLRKRAQELVLEFNEPGGPEGILRPGVVSSITVYSYSSHPLRFRILE